MRSALGPCLLVLTLFLAACGAPQSSGASPQGGQRQYGKIINVQGGSYRAITTDDLVEMVRAQDPFLVNVHIPYEGEIEGTDAFIPFNEVEKHLDALPADKNATIVLYCRSGTMSASAAPVLARLGYTEVFDLKGGMKAWKASGHQVLILPH